MNKFKGLLAALSLFCLPVLTTNSHAALTAGDLVITEVMANPAVVSDTNGEWFEIFNTTHAMVDLNGLVLSDTGSNLHTVNSPAPVLIGSGEYFVFGRNADISINGGYDADYGYSGFTLGNSSDAIILSFGSVVIDSLIYNDAGLFGAAGNSAEWTPTGFQLTPASFLYGDGDIGTPGSPGSFTPALTSPVPLPASAWLFISAISLLGLRKNSA